MTGRRRAVPELAPPVTFPREEFLAERWRYTAGEHVTFLGPTKSGKTTLAFQLLARSATVRLPAVVLAMKPRDPTVSDWSKALRFRTERTWPPSYQPWRSKPPGWCLWPKHRFDPDDDYRIASEFHRAILDSYKRGNRILFADELHGICGPELNRPTEFGFSTQRDLVTVWSRGRSMGCGVWGGTQRPAHVPLWAYSQAEHLFLANEPDKRARMRYAEIGGLTDPDWIEYHVLRLQRHQWLYLRRDGPAYCVVDR